MHIFVLLLQEFGLATKARAGNSDFLALSLPPLPSFPPGLAAIFMLCLRLLLYLHFCHMMT